MRRPTFLPAAIAGIVAICLVAVLGLVVLGIWVGRRPLPAVPTAAPTAVAVATRPIEIFSQPEAGSLLAPPPPGAPLSDVAASDAAVAVVQRVAPAVVTVINEQRSGRFGTGPFQETGSGTGFIIDRQGHVVTNWHVVTGGDRFQVILANGELRPAKLLGADQLSDLAVVQIGGAIPATVPLGDSAELEPGQTVLAIGSPLGQFTNTVTKGIVSALGRSLSEQPGQPELTGLIQHDAPINPGNSGGPLFDLSGEVVGVNTLGLPEDNGQPVQGIFFAIPSNTVKEIAAKLIATGEVAYPYLGIQNVAVTDEIASQNNLPVDYGVYVASVVTGSPASKAGIRQGDIILTIAGQRIDANHPLTEILFRYAPGDTVALTVQRGGRQFTANVTLGTRPAP